MHRREFIVGTAAAAGFVPAYASDAAGWNGQAFSAKTFAGAVHVDNSGARRTEETTLA